MPQVGLTSQVCYGDSLAGQAKCLMFVQGQMHLSPGPDEQDNSSLSTEYSCTCTCTCTCTLNMLYSFVL